MRHVPWHVKGVRPDAREVARDAARRSGLSVGEWLNSLIIDAAAHEDPHGDSIAGDYQEPADPPAHSHPSRDADARFSSIRRDIDDLKWQVGRLAQGHDARYADRSDHGDRRGNSRLAESISRIERQLEGLSRSARPQTGYQADYPASPQNAIGSQTGLGTDFGGNPGGNLGVDDAFAEIAARQQLLDTEAPEIQPFGATAFGHEMPRPQLDPSAIEQQLRDIAARIKTLQSPSRCDNVAAEIARTIERAAPKRSIEAIEDQLRRLTAQLEAMRPSGQANQLADHVVESLRRDVADIARRINDAMPQRAVAAIEEQIRALSDQVTRLQQPPRAEDIAAVLRKDFAEFRATLKDAAPPQNMASIEEQVRALTGEVAKLHPPLRVEDVAGALRRDFGEISTAVENAFPHRTVASIEEQIHALTGEVAKLQPTLRAEDFADAVRHQLGEISAAVNNAFPQRAVASIEEQVNALNAQISKLHAPPSVEEIANALRQDLVEIGAVLHEAMPTSAIAALDQEVRALGERLEASRAFVAESPATAEFEQALAEIRDRLRALTPAEDLAELSHAIKSLSRKADAIASESTAPEMLHQLEQAIGALHGLASQVASQDAVAGLSRDIHSLGDKIDRTSRQAADPDIMVTLERRLAEMAEAVGRSRSPEGPVPQNFDTIIKTLADRLEATQIPAADQDALRSLEQRIVTLVDKLEQSEARLSRQELERQEREQLDRQNLDRQDIGGGDSHRHDGVERGMEELLAQLKELRLQNEHKLQAIQQQLVASAAEAISAPAEAIRRDVASLKEIQASADRRTQDTFEAVYGTIEQVVDRLATIEEGLRGRQKTDLATAPITASSGSKREPPAESPLAQTASAPVVLGALALAPTTADRIAAAPAVEPPVRPESTGKAAPSSGNEPAKPGATPAQARQPIISDLPPDSPLEPGSGARRVRVVANAIDRIAASEAVNGAANGVAKSAETAPPARASFVAAARRAAQAVAHEQGDAPAARAEKTIQDPKEKAPPSKLMQKLGPRIKSIVLGISVILLVLGALRLALDLFYNPDTGTPPVTRTDDATQPGGDMIPPAPQPSPSDPSRTGKGAGLLAPAPSGPRAATAFPAEMMRGHAPISGVLPEPAASAPRVSQPPLPGAGLPDSTGSLPIRNPLLQGPALQQPAAPQTVPARDLTREALPAAIGSKALVAAAIAGEPGASFEIATRFAEGRNVPQDLAMAAAWFDRAARSGLAPAQFRLGSMYEKGTGIKKDLAEARRLYVAASDKGNAKAMHNLAVLYAEGLDGKPDYAVASEWFRKAAAFGVTDSQYNLAILYARGVGVERNVAESYKWFALAAKGGDKDAAKKRDEIAARLDAAQLESAKQAAEAFVPEPQPDEATSTKAPLGGWDQVVAAAPTRPKGSR